MYIILFSFILIAVSVLEGTKQWSVEQVTLGVKSIASAYSYGL